MGVVVARLGGPFDDRSARFEQRRLEAGRIRHAYTVIAGDGVDAGAGNAPGHLALGVRRHELVAFGQHDRGRHVDLMDPIPGVEAQDREGRLADRDRIALGDLVEYPGARLGVGDPLGEQASRDELQRASRRESPGGSTRW